MQLNARARRQKKEAEKTEKKTEPLKEEQSTNVRTKGALSETIQVHYNSLHYTTLQNSIASQHSAGDFTYTSVSDLIRAGLKAYKEGMQLTEQSEKGNKVQISVRLDREMKSFFDSLPNQLKSKITERAVRTFVKNQFH